MRTPVATQMNANQIACRHASQQGLERVLPTRLIWRSRRAVGRTVLRFG